MTVDEKRLREKLAPGLVGSVSDREVLALLDELDRVRFDRNEHVEELRAACDEKQEAIEQLQHDLSEARVERDDYARIVEVWRKRHDAVCDERDATRTALAAAHKALGMAREELSHHAALGSPESIAIAVIDAALPTGEKGGGE